MRFLRAGADRATLLRAQTDTLKLEVLFEWMNRPITPDNVVLVDRNQVLGSRRQSTGDCVKHKARVKGCNERNVNAQTGRILDLGNFHTEHLLASFLRDQIDFPEA